MNERASRGTAPARAARWSARSAVLLVAIVVLAGGLVGLWAPERAAASCAGPQVSVGVGPATPVPVSESAAAVAVRPGERLVVRGEWFHTGCDDTSASGPGCAGPHSSSTQQPMTGVQLSLESGSSTRQLGVADAGDAATRYALSYDVVVPVDVRPGPATLRVGPVGVPVEVVG